MNLRKYKWLFYMFTFFLVTIVATVMKEVQGESVPQVSSAIILVGILYASIYLVYKIGSAVFKRNNHNANNTNADNQKT